MWGFKSFSCINAVQNRAMRFCLGVGKYTPNAAVYGEMGWVPPIVRQWKSTAIFCARLSQTNNSQLNKRIAVWAYSQSIHCKNWFHFVKKKQFLSLNPTATLEKNRQEKITYLSFLSVFSSAFLRLHWRETDQKNTSIYPSCLFFSTVLLRLHWRKTDKKNTPIYLSCLFFSHLLSYGYIGEKQTRKIYLFIFLVCFSYLPCYGYIGKKQTRKK